MITGDWELDLLIAFSIIVASIGMPIAVGIINLGRGGGIVFKKGKDGNWSVRKK